MVEQKIAGWLLNFTKTPDTLAISVNREDKSIVMDTGEEIGSEDEMGYRFTSRTIEDDYNANGEANAGHVSEQIFVGKWRVDMVNDNDNHLNVYCKSLTSDALLHVSSVNGSASDPTCKVSLSDKV